jgi:hypothetical protein
MLKLLLQSVLAALSQQASTNAWMHFHLGQQAKCRIGAEICSIAATKNKLELGSIMTKYKQIGNTQHTAR